MVLIDTSAWIEAIRKGGKSEVRDRVHSLLESGESRLSEPVLIELFHGARGSSEISFIKELEESVPILRCNKECFEKSMQVAISSRKKGITVSSMDILIFSIAKQYGASVYSLDKHFIQLSKL